MAGPAKLREAMVAGAALILWLATVILGLESLYALMLLIPFVYGLFGGSTLLAERVTAVLGCVLGLILMLVVFGTAEYHRKRVGQPESWRVFGVTLAVELAILLLHYFLFNLL